MCLELLPIPMPDKIPGRHCRKTSNEIHTSKLTSPPDSDSLWSGVKCQGEVQVQAGAGLKHKQGPPENVLPPGS